MNDEFVDTQLPEVWIRHWHSVLDEHFGVDPKFDIEEAIKDPYIDFRMHFMTWDLPNDLLHRCFAVLPGGPEVCDRAIEMRARLRETRNTKISEADAIRLFQQGLEELAAFVSDPDLKKPVRIIRGSRSAISELMAQTDRVAIVLESYRFERPFLPGHVQAMVFLGETLYRLASSYDVADYVSWPLMPALDPPVDPMRCFAELAFTDFFARLGADGPVLFVEID